MAPRRCLNDLPGQPQGAGRQLPCRASQLGSFGKRLVSRGRKWSESKGRPISGKPYGTFVCFPSVPTASPLFRPVTPEVAGSSPVAPVFEPPANLKEPAAGFVGSAHVCCESVLRGQRLRGHVSSNPLCSNLSVVAFSETVRTFASSNPSGDVASTSIVTFNVTPGVAARGPRTSSATFLKSDA